MDKIFDYINNRNKRKKENSKNKKINFHKLIFFLIYNYSTTQNDTKNIQPQKSKSR
jgi:CRISPR/Cas system CSM-associated protein Csm2 small subunit